MSLKEITAGKINDLIDGEMKVISIGDDKEILLSRIDGEIFATGAHCTHYGAPLADGVLSGDTIICPWHHACFNAKSGDLMEPPARDALPRYEVEIKDENIIIKAPEDFTEQRIPDMSKPDNLIKTNYVIIGGGASGNAAAQAMREAGYKGKITMITKENRVPYDRPNLSKAYLQGEAEEEWMPLRGEDFYEEYGIEILFEKEVGKIDTEQKEIHFKNGGSIKYDKLLIAPGGTPNKLNIEGSELENIFYLRSFADCEAIINASAEVKNIAVIGASFIAMEAAFSLNERLKSAQVTIIAPEKVPFGKVFGKEIGNEFKRHHEENGINFKLRSKIKKFEGNGKVTSVILEDGSKIDADLVLVGIGVKPATGFLTNFNLNDNGSLNVDENMKVEDDVYASGDVASFPAPASGKRTRIEHWRLAEQHGRVAGMNMAGETTKYTGIPFFWTKQGSFGLSYVGHADDWDETITLGKIEEKDFIVFYLKDDKILAASGTRDKEMAAIQLLMRTNKMPSADALKAGKANVLKLI